MSGSQKLDNKTLDGERQKDKSSPSNPLRRGRADYMDRHADKSSFPWKPSVDSQRIDNMIVGQTSLPLATLSRYITRGQTTRGQTSLLLATLSRYITRQITRRTDKSSSGNPLGINIKGKGVCVCVCGGGAYRRLGSSAVLFNSTKH